MLEVEDYMRKRVKRFLYRDFKFLADLLDREAGRFPFMAKCLQ